jgi:hypothetical protein
MERIEKPHPESGASNGCCAIWLLMRSKVRAYSHQGHGPRADQQAGYISASPIPPPHLRRAAGSLIAASASSKFALSCPGHGSLRGQQQLPHHLVRPEALALQGPQRAYDLITCPPAARAIACTLAQGQRSRLKKSANELRLLRCGLRCPAERLASPPYTVQNYRQFPGQGDSCLAGT